MKRISWLLVIATFVLPAAVSAENWPAWRGASGIGVSSDRQLPTTFSPTDNVSWKAALPAAGNSTPIVWDDRVFVTCQQDGGKIRSLICFDRNNGEKLWQHSVAFPQAETAHNDNPFCSGSPATDGTLVYASFDSAGVVACNFSGKVVWQRDLGKLNHVCPSFHFLPICPCLVFLLLAMESYSLYLDVVNPLPRLIEHKLF